MGLRELKEVAHQQFVRGKFAQCAQTYHQVLRLAPRDPNMRVRHAEACRRAGDRLQAIASYRAAAELLLELGCESRARGALKAALELDPRDPLLQADVARLGPHHEEPFSAGLFEHEELPTLPPLESGLDPVPPAPQALRPVRALLPEDPLRTTALPPIHRALPSAPSVAPLGPPVLLPAPRVPSAAAGTAPAPSASRTEKMGAAMASAAKALPPTLRRPVNAGHVTPAPQPPATPPPVLSPVQAQAAATPESAKASGPRLEVRRLSASSIAFRCSPNDSWAVIRSHTPLEVHLVENLEHLPPMLRDFAVDITVEPEAASNAVH